MAEKKAAVAKRAEIAMKKIEETCAQYTKDNVKGGVLEIDIGTDGNTANKLMTKVLCSVTIQGILR